MPKRCNIGKKMLKIFKLKMINQRVYLNKCLGREQTRIIPTPLKLPTSQDEGCCCHGNHYRETRCRRVFLPKLNSNVNSSGLHHRNKPLKPSVKTTNTPTHGHVTSWTMQNGLGRRCMAIPVNRPNRIRMVLLTFFDQRWRLRALNFVKNVLEALKYGGGFSVPQRN